MTTLPPGQGCRVTGESVALSPANLIVRCVRHPASAAFVNLTAMDGGVGSQQRSGSMPKMQEHLLALYRTKKPRRTEVLVKLERETRLELATPTLARSCNTN